MKSVYKLLINWISRNKVLTVILIIAAILRFVGIYPGYPSSHPDEGAIYGTSAKMIKSLTLDPRRYDYAALPMIIHALVYIIINPFFIIYSFIFDPDNLPKFKNVLDFFQNTIWINATTSVIYWGRSISAIFGIGVVFMVYQVSIRFFNSKNIGLVAAFLTAINYRQVLNSHIILPDIYNAFFLLLSFYILAHLLKNPSRRNYLLSGLILGLYFSIKYHVFALGTFALVHFINSWMVVKKHTLKSIIENKRLLLKSLFRVDVITSLGLLFLTILVINFFLFLHLDEFIATNSYQARQYRLGINNLDLYSFSYLYHTGIGQIISIFVLLGIGVGLKKYTIPTLLFISTIIPFFYFLTYYGNGGFYTRNFVTIIPLLLIFAGLFLVEVSTLASSKLRINGKYKNILIIVLLVASSWGSIKNSVLNVFYFAQPQSYQIAKQWAQDNIPNGSIIAARTIDKFNKKKQIKVVNFEYNDTFTLAEMQEKGVDYGYLALDELNLMFYWWMKEDTRQALAYWDKSITDNISQNMFAAKVAQELSSWSIATFVKPWQAPDVNYLVIKVPKPLEFTNKKTIQEFLFDKEDELFSWVLISGYNKKIENIYVDPLVGRSKNGSIRISEMGAYPNVVRVVSPVISLNNNDKKGKAYEVTGWIKINNILNPRDKDGYFIVDFYKDYPKNISLTSKSDYTALSSRVWGTNDWVFKKITVIAPADAKFMTVGVGLVGPNTIWFDDFVVSESEDKFTDPRTGFPYLNYYKIPQNILFPLSHGNW